MRILSTLLVSLFYFISLSSQCTINGVGIASMLVDPNGTNNFDTDGDGVAETEDEFVEICNTSAVDVDISGWTIDDNADPIGSDFAFPAGTILAAGECVVLIRNWVTDPPTSPPPGVFSMGLGGGWLNNGGDNVYLSDGTSVCEVSYGSTACTLPAPDCDDWGGDMDGCVDVAGTADCSYVPAALPVEFGSFKVNNQNGKAVLSWTTLSEINNELFEIEWSVDGRNFVKIDEVKGAGNSATILEYQVTHLTPMPNLNYYRLKQVDFDGNFSYSVIEVIRLSQRASQEVSFYPNPVNDILVVSTDEKTRLEIFSLNSELLLDIYIDHQKTIDVSNFPKGMNIMRFSSNGKVTIENLIKI